MTEARSEDEEEEVVVVVVEEEAEVEEAKRAVMREARLDLLVAAGWSALALRATARTVRSSDMVAAGCFEADGATANASDRVWRAVLLFGGDSGAGGANFAPGGGIRPLAKKIFTWLCESPDTDNRSPLTADPPAV